MPVQPRSRRDFNLAGFRQRDNSIAAWQLFSTLAPTAVLWAMVPSLAVAPGLLRLLLLPVLLLVRLPARQAQQQQRRRERRQRELLPPQG